MAAARGVRTLPRSTDPGGSHEHSRHRSTRRRRRRALRRPRLRRRGRRRLRRQPATGSPAADYARWLADNAPTTGTYAGAFLALIGLLAFVVFAAALYDVLRRSERERTWLPTAALGAALVSAAIKIGSAPALLAAFSVRNTVDPQLAKVLVEMNDYAFLLTWALDAVMLGAVAACALRTNALPRWLAIAAGGSSRRCCSPAVAGGNQAPPFGFLLGFLWFVAASVVLVRPRYALGRDALAAPTAHWGAGEAVAVSARPSLAVACSPCPRSISTGSPRSTPRSCTRRGRRRTCTSAG